MPNVRFLNQKPTPRTRRNDGGPSFWDALALLGAVVAGVAVTLVTRHLLSRTSWSGGARSVALAGGGIVLGSIAAGLRRGAIGAGIASSAVGLAVSDAFSPRGSSVFARSPSAAAPQAVATPPSLPSPIQPSQATPVIGAGPALPTGAMPPLPATPGPALHPGVIPPVFMPQQETPTPTPTPTPTSRLDDPGSYPFMVRYGAPPRPRPGEFDDA